MNLQSFSRAFIIASAFLAGCGDDLSVPKAVAQGPLEDAKRRFSNLDDRFDKAEKKIEELQNRLIFMEHPLGAEKGDPGVDITTIRGDVSLLRIDAEDLLRDVSGYIGSIDTRHAPGSHGARTDFQQCRYLRGYWESKPVDDNAFMALIDHPVFRGLNNNFYTARFTRNDLYDLLAKEVKPDDIARVTSSVDLYAAQVEGLERNIASAVTEIEGARRGLNGIFLKLWEQRVLLTMGVEECRREYTNHQRRATPQTAEFR